MKNEREVKENEELVKKQIQAMIDRETLGWNTKNPDLFLDMIHPDMVWCWAPHPDAHDPIDWVFELGHFDRERWRKNWQNIFDNYDLIRNDRKTAKIEVTKEHDGAFAVVDIDTHWRHKVMKEDFPWKGRVCKIYTKLQNGEWKMFFQTGALRYPPRPFDPSSIKPNMIKVKNDA
jgi:ketosteroid isomerase-like protein